eukprot:COSAG02_NODE_5067_length_4676_cov_2.057243_4_plen_115_part_00
MACHDFCWPLLQVSTLSPRRSTVFVSLINLQMAPTPKRKQGTHRILLHRRGVASEAHSPATRCAVVLDHTGQIGLSKQRIIIFLLGGQHPGHEAAHTLSGALNCLCKRGEFLLQ